MLDILRGRSLPENPTIDDQRRYFDELMARAGLPSNISITEIDAGGVPAEWLELNDGASDSQRTVLYLHGGAYRICSPATHRALAAKIAVASDASTLVLDYRLAPEHPFPAAVEDTFAAYQWLLDQGIPAGQVVVAGDSAGAGLALAVIFNARDAGLPLPSSAVCLSPWFDLACSGESMTTLANEKHLAQKEGLLEDAAVYLNGHDPYDPLASPLYGDLEALPPILIQVGGAESLLDDATRFAERASQAGTRIDLEIWPDMVHVWHLLAGLLPEDDPMPEAQQAIDRIAEFIQQQTSSS